MMTTSRNIRKKNEFKKFIESIEKGSICHWLNIGEALGVDKETIRQWKELPEAQEAIIKGIEHAVKKMEESGKRDWRMWESKLKMLGVSPIERHEVMGKLEFEEVKKYSNKELDAIIQNKIKENVKTGKRSPVNGSDGKGNSQGE